MAVPTVTDFKSEFPEFASLTDDTITRVITRALRFHDDTKEGAIYAAAHLYSIDLEKAANHAPDGGAGVVTKESLGPKSVEYMTTAGDDERRAFWSRTPYGREFLKIEERNPRQAFGMLAV